VSQWFGEGRTEDRKDRGQRTEKTEVRSQRTEDGKDRGQKSEVRGRKRQRSEVRGQRTEKTEGRRRKTEIGKRQRAEDRKDRGQRSEVRDREKTGVRGQKTEDGGGAMSKKILSFRDLEVYKTAFTLQQEIFEISKVFRKRSFTHLRIRFVGLQDL